MLRSKLILLLFVCSIQLAVSQDIHFSQFNRSYLNLNPAETGNFDGDFRFNGNFKNQWSSVSEPYRTFSASIDANSLIKTLPGLQLGIALFNDEAGLGGLKTTQANLSVAYGYALNLDSTLIVRTGIQLGYTSRSINFDQFSFDTQYNGNRYDGNLGTGENFDKSSISSSNLNAGFGLEYIYDSRKKFNVGFGLFNITSPNQSFEGISSPLKQRVTINLGSDYMIKDNMDLLPSILISRQGKFKELLIGTDLRYRLNGRALASNLYGGIWYRNQDAIIVSTGLDYLQWNLGLSYDINISDLESASNNRGGLEISITYTFKNFKPTIRRYKVCPNFM